MNIFHHLFDPLKGYLKTYSISHKNITDKEPPTLPRMLLVIRHLGYVLYMSLIMVLKFWKDPSSIYCKIRNTT